MPARKPKPIAVPITATDKISKRLDKISSKIERLRAPIDRVRKAFQRLDKAAGLRNVGASLRRIGGNLTRFVTLPLAAAGAASIKFSIDLNKGLANVGTLIPGQISKLKQFKTEIQSLSIETGKMTGDLTDGLFDVISAFGDTGDSMERLRVITEAAIAGQSDNKTSLALLSAVTKAYGDTSIDALKNVSDLAFKVNEFGQTNFPEMASAIRGVTTSSITANVKMKEMFGVFATATGVTGNASEVATQYESALKAMLIPNKEMAIVIDKLGFKSAKAMIKQIGLKNAFLSIAKGAKENNFELEKLFGRFEGFKLVGALTGRVQKDFIKKMGDMNNVTGAATLALKEQTEGINKTGHQLRQFLMLVIVVAQKIGDELAPVLANLVSKLVPLGKAFINMSSSARKTILVAAAIVAAIGPLIFIIGALISALGILGPAFITGAIILKSTIIPAIIKFNLALLANPVLFVAAGILLIIGLLLKFTKLFDPIVNKIKSFFGFVDKNREIGIDGPEIPETIGGNVRKHFIERETTNINKNEASIQLDITGAPKGSNLTVKKNKGISFDSHLGLVGSD